MPETLEILCNQPLSFILLESTRYPLKRIGHAAMETFLILNGFEVEASVDDQEKIILDLADGRLNREKFTTWLHKHIIHITSS